MALRNIIYETCDILPSCQQGRSELQVGEQVKITLQPKNPLWPSSLIATVIAVESTYGGRNYTFQFDDAVLNGGPLFQGCDVVSVTAYCCCDEMMDHVIAEANEGGTVTIHNFDGGDVCVLACPPDGVPEGYVPSIGPDGAIVWGPSGSTTYTLTGESQPFERLIHLNGSDGSVSTASVPELHDGVPTLGTYAPDVNDRVTIPVTRTDFSTGGIPVALGDVVIDLSVLAGHEVTGFNYDAATNSYDITFDNGATYSVPATTVNTSVPGQVTITDPEGNTVTLSTQDIHVSGYAYAANQYTITLNSGATFSVPATTVDTSVPDQVTITGPDGGSVVIPLSGIGSGVASLELLPDPFDPCSNWVVLTTNSGTIHEVGPLGNPNTAIPDPSSSEHATPADFVFNGYGLEGENPAANGGLYLPADGGETRGTGGDFIKTISRKEDCSALTRIASGRRAGATTVIDGKFFSDTPRYEREDHPFASMAAVPSGVSDVAEVYRFQGGTAGDVSLNTTGRVALNFSETHTAGNVSLTGGTFRSSGCPDCLSLAIDVADFSGRIGDILLDNANTYYLAVTDSKIQIQMGGITAHAGFTGWVMHLQNANGYLEFTNVFNPGPFSAIRCNGCGDFRLKGGFAGADTGTVTRGIELYQCTNVAVEVERISSGWQGIESWESLNVTFGGREVRTEFWANFVGNAVIFVSGDRTPHAEDSCTIEFDQVVRGGQFDGWVLYLFDYVKVRAFRTLFVHEYNGSGPNHAVFCSAKNSVPVTNVLSLYDCAAKVADSNMAVFEVLTTTTEVHIHGTFKTNSTVIETVPSGFLFIMTGTIELGEPVA